MNENNNNTFCQRPEFGYNPKYERLNTLWDNLWYFLITQFKHSNPEQYDELSLKIIELETHLKTLLDIVEHDERTYDFLKSSENENHLI